MTNAAAASPGQVAGRPVASDQVRKGGWYALAVLLALTLFAFVDRQVLTLAAAPMAVSLDLSDSELGMVQGLAFAIFTVVAVYPIAWAADRFDRRIVLGLCVVTWSVGTAACGLAANFEQLFAAAVLIAAGEAGLMPIIISLIPELFTGRKRLLANGLFYVFGFLGIAAGLALGGGAIGFLDAVHGDLPTILQSLESWRLAFFLVALPAPILLVLLAFLPIRRAARPELTPDTAGAPFLPFVKRNAGAVGPIFLALSFYMLAFGGYLVWLPIATTRLFGATPAENGAAMGIATALGMIGGVSLGTFIVRRLIGRMGPLATIRFFWISMLVAAPILLGFPFIRTSWQAFALFGLLMFAGTAVGCMVPTLLQDMAPADIRARLAAVWGIASGLFGGIAPTLVGWMSSALGSEPRLLLVAMSLVAAPCWLAAIILFRIAERPFDRLVREVGAHQTGVASR